LARHGLAKVAVLEPFDLKNSKSGVLQKANRYLFYQAKTGIKALTTSNSIFHIIDHGYAHLGWGLPLSRQLVTVHDLILLKYQNGTLPLNGEKLPRASIRSFAFSLKQIKRLPFIIADSQATARDLNELTGIDTAKIRVVYLGIAQNFQPLEDTAYLETVRVRYNLPQKFVLHVGQSSYYKNLDTVLNAFAALGEEFRAVKLVKVGNSLTEAQRNQANKLGIASRIVELGFMPFADLPAIYNLAQVLFFPSLHEGFGLPPLEAMACGTPVLTANVSALPEVVGQAAISLPPKATTAYTAALQQLLSDPAKRIYYRQLGLQQAKKFNWAETARQTAQVYQELFELNGVNYVTN
jgi:glycosyltransferase involved in cell wall biosynthesis